MTAEVRRAGRAVIIAAHVAVALCLVGAWLLPLKRFATRRWPGQRNRLTRWWMRRLLVILGVRLETAGHAAPPPALIVANHISWLDIPCLLAVTDARFVAKTEVASWPLIGWLAASAGTLFLARGAAGAAAERMIRALATGERVAVYPEGTSTDGGSMRPFHARLYQAAIRTGVPVQAVAIRYPRAGGAINPAVPFVDDDDFVGHLWRLLGEREIVAQLHFCPPLASGNVSRRVLAGTTRRQISVALGQELPPLSYFTTPGTSPSPTGNFPRNRYIQSDSLMTRGEVADETDTCRVDALGGKRHGLGRRSLRRQGGRLDPDP
jgi:1-acyl-sn-glycerol-3-phosphate acyltransferase